MSHDGGVVADLNGTAAAAGGGNPGEASDIPKHGFGPADPAAPTDMAGVETASIIAQPSPVVAPAAAGAAAAAAGAAAEGESAAAPVALAAALAVNQAALDGRPLDSMSGTPVAGSDLVASPTAQPMVRCEMDERTLSY